MCRSWRWIAIVPFTHSCRSCLKKKLKRSWYWMSCLGTHYGLVIFKDEFKNDLWMKYDRIVRFPLQTTQPINWDTRYCNCILVLPCARSFVALGESTTATDNGVLFIPIYRITELSVCRNWISNGGKTISRIPKSFPHLKVVRVFKNCSNTVWLTYSFRKRESDIGSLFVLYYVSRRRFNYTCKKAGLIGLG